MKAAERRATPTDENNRAAITTAAVGHFGAIVRRSMAEGGEAESTVRTRYAADARRERVSV